MERIIIVVRGLSDLLSRLTDLIATTIKIELSLVLKQCLLKAVQNFKKLQQNIG